jgi:triacylglycerol lipase
MIGLLKQGTYFLRACAREVGANVMAANLYPFGFFDAHLHARKHSHMAVNPRPIILVHGIVHNRSAFVYLKRRMEKLGWENIYPLNYSTFHGNIFHMVEQLTKKVEEVMKATGCVQVDIVAHSLGGIVSRTYMSMGEGRGKVRRLITLGTAHQGTALSFLAKGLSRGALDNDLRAGSFLIKLLENTTLPHYSEIVSIYSPFDWTVMPSANAVVRGTPERSFKNVKLDYLGHTGLLYSYEAFDIVTREILSSDTQIAD